MKKIALNCFFMGFLLLNAMPFFAQNIVVKEPDFIGKVLFVRPDDSTGIVLEKQIPHIHIRQDAGGYISGYLGKTRTLMELENAHSPVRFPANTKLMFVVKATDNQLDPSLIVQVFKMQGTNKTRKAELSTTGAFRTKQGDMEYVAFSAKKYGQNSYLILIDAPLAAGEYAIRLNTSNTAENGTTKQTANNVVLSLFGVD